MAVRSPPGSRFGQFALAVSPWAALVAALVWMARPPRRRPGLSVPAAAPPATFDKAEPGRGRAADAPQEIPAKGWKDILWRTAKEVSADRLSMVAASVTFYSLLAVFPALGVVVSLYGLVADVAAAREQILQIAPFVPAGVLLILSEQMQRLVTQDPPSLSLAFIVSLLVSVWSANAGMKALFDGLNVAYDETEKRNVVTLTATTYGFTLGALLFVTTAIGILVVTPIVFRAMGLSAFDEVWIPLRWLVLLAFTTVAFSVIYRFGPSRQLARWRWVTWGAVLAAFLWLAGSLAFSWYVNHLAHYDRTYGPLGAVIGFMMWIWFSVMVVLIGAELNAEIEHQTALDSTTGHPLPMGARGAAMADTVGLAATTDPRQAVKRLWSLARVRLTGS